MSLNSNGEKYHQSPESKNLVVTEPDKVGAEVSWTSLSDALTENKVIEDQHVIQQYQHHVEYLV